MLAFQVELNMYDIPLAVNQCEFSILRRYPEVSAEGVMKACREAGIVFSQSRLSGKYSEEDPPPKTYQFSSYATEDVEPALEVLRRIGEKRGKSVPSVALNYCVSKGGLPLVGIRNPEQGKDAIEALGWRLSKDEVVEIDRVSIRGKKTAL